ncbi:hypothetical protein W97_00448 [Coniosporium apollinis CBS 100218]|uniref:BTB domain-containing protein n=1 Tax=Coniosporium apollinis (strain CBS 100218) TaxID=1168221 RepID=R7YH50_CONA1|nr:uncharacterized protein W97_00448 [Coniosporium apollinis CBS 100218]EON61235.1 hypothetical protein W97_00448 [Coniosporium apollinis CBS 100218]
MQSGGGEAAADSTVSAVVVEDDKVVKKRKVDSEPARSSLHTFSSDVFEVHVGPEPVRFVLHETLACRVCPFFERAIQRGFAEATSRMITLADDEPETFSEVVSWIYRDELFPDIALPEYPKNIQLCKLWVLADKLCMPVLQNRIVEVIACKAKAQNRATSTETLDYIWSHTPRGARLRTVFVVICVRTMTKPDFWDRKETLPAEFVQEFCYALINTLDAAQPDRTRNILELQ